MRQRLGRFVACHVEFAEGEVQRRVVGLLAQALLQFALGEVELAKGDIGPAQFKVQCIIGGGLLKCIAEQHHRTRGIARVHELAPFGEEVR